LKRLAKGQPLVFDKCHAGVAWDYADLPAGLAGLRIFFATRAWDQKKLQIE